MVVDELELDGGSESELDGSRLGEEEDDGGDDEEDGGSDELDE